MPYEVICVALSSEIYSLPAYLALSSLRYTCWLALRSAEVVLVSLIL